MITKHPMVRLIEADIWLKMSLLVVALGLSVGLTGCGRVTDANVLTFDGTLARRQIASATPDHPVPLRPDEVTELRLTVTNVSPNPVTVAHVRLEGELLDLIFLTYDTGIHETIAPGEERLITFPIDFFDLRGQAHGYLRGHLRLYGPDRSPLGSRSLTLDGRGSPWATMVSFNLVLAAVSVASFGWNLLRLAQRRLPANRFVRGLRFIHSGAATGLTLAAASSTLRIWPLATTGWILMTVIVSLFAFGLGYLSPGGGGGDDGGGDGGGGEPIIDLNQDHPGPVARVGADGQHSVESTPWMAPSTSASS